MNIGVVGGNGILDKEIFQGFRIVSKAMHQGFDQKTVFDADLFILIDLFGVLRMRMGWGPPGELSMQRRPAEERTLIKPEETFPRFLADWEAGRAAPVYRPESKPEVTATPVPRKAPRRASP